MDYKKITNKAYNIHLIKTDKFKTISIRINFKRLLTKEEITYRNLLVELLLESNNNFKNRRMVDIESEELYGINLSAYNTISGNYNIMQFRTSFLNEKYTEEGMNEKSLTFFFDFLFNPNVKDNKFDKSSFNNAQNIVRENIEMLDETYSDYSMVRLGEEMGKDSNLKYSSLGYIEDLEKITNENLYSYYEKVLKSDIVDIFVIGDFNFDLMKNMIEDKLKIKTIKKESKSHYISHDKFRIFERKIKENKNINQSILLLGYKIEDTTLFEQLYTARLYSYLLGGGPDSKLFQTVREKNSLCYGISSIYLPVSNLLVIKSGINADDYKKALSLIKKEVKNMNKGNFTDEDIEKAKTMLVSSFKEIDDDPYSIINAYVSKEYLNYDLIDKRINEVLKVTKEDIMHFSKKIHSDTIFFLEGDMENEEDAS